MSMTTATVACVHVRHDVFVRDTITRRGKRAPGPVPPWDVSTRQGSSFGSSAHGTDIGFAVGAEPSAIRALACSKGLLLGILAR